MLISDYNSLNKIGIHEFINKLINREKRRIFLTIQAQLINTDGMIEIDNHHGYYREGGVDRSHW